MDSANGVIRVLHEFARRVRLLRIANVHQRVRISCQSRHVRFRATDVEAAINKARIDTDNFGAEPLGKRERERCFAGRGRPHEEDDRWPINAAHHSSTYRLRRAELRKPT